MVKQFSNNPDVAFADINLSENRINNGPNGGSFGWGRGGWPTIRYFNTETGYDGAPYAKKTEHAMCTELGPAHEYMRIYVEESGKTSAENTAEL